MSSNARLALVTGAGAGIGREVAIALAASGHHVLVSSRTSDRTAGTVETIRESGGSAQALTLDLTDSDSIAAAAGVAGDGALDVLVHNAAAYADWTETVSGADVDHAEEVMATNLFGTWRLTQALLPALRRSAAPRVVVVTSAAGSYGDPAFGLATGPAVVSYAVSKAALTAWTVKLAAELGDAARVNAVDPGLTATAPGMAEMGARPAADSAPGIVWAATLPADGPTGGLFRDGVALPW